jgi:hypothetical protein
METKEQHDRRILQSIIDALNKNPEPKKEKKDEPEFLDAYVKHVGLWT